MRFAFFGFEKNGGRHYIMIVKMRMPESFSAASQSPSFVDLLRCLMEK